MTKDEEEPEKDIEDIIADEQEEKVPVSTAIEAGTDEEISLEQPGEMEGKDKEDDEEEGASPRTS